MQPTTQATKKDSSDKKDNYIVRGWGCDPQCVIA
ncbi:LAMI_0B01123g1_1 [Lachancea mirantina]|uniref:LAMI_0B01123g1_1 n=1 Tax=Lachancea mirantina TaxID=1230905 RepID=A0A1G4IT98_9SACH|nr:LAMI_0B01123g1_1 [Lachancea mirantina]